MVRAALYSSHHVHYMGSRTDAQYAAVVKVWVHPDFSHKWHACRMFGDIDTERDIVVSAGKAHPD